MAAIESILDTAAIARLLALPLNARQAMLGNVSGRHRSPVRGSSLEFAQYRKYVPGDDLRRLDWRTWGRTDRFYIKEFEADTNLRLCLVVDASGSMDYRSPGAEEGATRMQMARRLAASLAYLAAHQGDAVGLWGVGADHKKKVPCKRGATHLQVVMEQLAELKPVGETTVVESIHQVAEEIRQRALVVLISDFFVDPAELRKAIQHLRFRRHDVALFHLMAREEIDFEFERPARFLDLEGQEAILADPTLVAVRYRKVVSEYLMAMDELVRTTGVDYQRLGLTESVEQVLAAFLLARLRQGKR
jgi:uncharacterized protein (DUF58 family)